MRKNIHVSQYDQHLNELTNALKQVKEVIEIDYGSVKKKNASTFIRYYTETAYTFADLLALIDQCLANFDKKTPKRHENVIKEEVFSFFEKTTYKELLDECISAMKNIMYTVKQNRAEQYTREYMQNNNIPEIPAMHTQCRLDSFISQNGPGNAKHDGLFYNVIVSNPFPKEASDDIKLLVSQIWPVYLSEVSEKKKINFCQQIHDRLADKSVCLGEQKYMSEEPVYAYGFDEYKDGSYRSGSGIDPNNFGGIFGSTQEKENKTIFYYVLANVRYECPLESFMPYHKELTQLQQQIPGSIHFNLGFSSPTCGVYYISSEENFKVLGIRDLFTSHGDRKYRLPKGRLEQAMDSVLSPQEIEIFTSYKNQIEVVESKVALFYENRKRQETLLAVLKECEYLDKAQIVQHMPDFVEHLMQIKNYSSVQIDLESQVASYIEGYWDYNGSGGSEYGLYIKARHNGSLQQEKVVYRDRYDHNKDDPSLNFDRLSIQNVQKDEQNKNLVVQVLAQSKEKEKTFSFVFPILEKKVKTVLSLEEQTQFTTKYTEVKFHILQEKAQEYAGKMMPAYCWPWPWQGMSGQPMAYESPQVVSEAVDQGSGQAVFVVKMQISHSPGVQKMEWEREAFVVDASGTVKTLQRECRWHNEIASGDGVQMDAKELLYDLQK